MRDINDDGGRFEPNLEFASALTPESCDWLWPGRIPLGALTLLVGDPGVGKSLLAADLAARVSAGIPWPAALAPAAAAPAHNAPCAAWEYSPPVVPPGSPRPVQFHHGGVIIVCHEDDRRSGIVPRLMSAGADLASVAIIDGVYREPARHVLRSVFRPPERKPGSPPDAPFQLPEHLRLLQAAVRSVSAPRLVILDTLHSLLGLGAHASPDKITATLQGLAETAAVYHVAVVAIHHLTKTQAPRTLYRVRGAISFVAAARAAFLVSPDPAHPGRRFLSTLKSIYSAPAAPIPFEIVPRPLDPPGFFERPIDGRPPTPSEVDMRRRWENPFRDPIPAIRWSDPRDLRGLTTPILAADAEPLPEELLDLQPASRSAFLEARAWLADYLAAGPQPAATIIHDAKTQGHSLRTLRRAKQSLGIVSNKSDRADPWVWCYRPASGGSVQRPDNEGCQPIAREKESLAPFSQDAGNAV